jgi:hypothetical protein
MKGAMMRPFLLSDADSANVHIPIIKALRTAFAGLAWSGGSEPIRLRPKSALK